MQSKNFHAKVWKVSLENTTTRFGPVLCAPTKLVQIAVLETTKMKQKSSMTNGVHRMVQL